MARVLNVSSKPTLFRAPILINSEQQKKIVAVINASDVERKALQANTRSIKAKEIALNAMVQVGKILRGEAV